MVVFKDAQTYFEQSKLLIQARPSTTRISTKYSVPKSRPSRTRRPRKDAANDGSSSQPAEDSSAAPSNPAQSGPKAHLTLKTYDPVSGTCLKYNTDKQAEVGRLIAGLGRLARDFAALPEASEDQSTAAGADGTSTPMEVDSGAAPSEQAAGQAPHQQAAKQGGQGSGGGGGGGGGGKKKGKKGKR